MTGQDIVEVKDLTVEFSSPRGPVRPVDSVSLTMTKGQVLGVVGEAGAGKTVLVRSLLRLLPEGAQVVQGSIRFNGRDILGMSDAELKSIRGTGMAHILPDAKLQLNPLLKIGDLMVAVVRTHEKCTKTEARQRATALLRTVGITDPGRRLDAYPHELSGGMAQRVCIALALMHSPSVIIADEPTAGLDVTVQRQVLDLMAGLVRERDAAQLIVTRDFGIVAHYCQWVAVMQRGRIIESASTRQLFDAPQHQYTRELLSASRADRLTQSIRRAIAND